MLGDLRESGLPIRILKASRVRKCTRDLTTVASLGLRSIEMFLRSSRCCFQIALAIGGFGFGAFSFLDVAVAVGTGSLKGRGGWCSAGGGDGGAGTRTSGLAEDFRGGTWHVTGLLSCVLVALFASVIL